MLIAPQQFLGVYSLHYTKGSGSKLLQIDLRNSSLSGVLSVILHLRAVRTWAVVDLEVRYSESWNWPQARNLKYNGLLDKQ